MSPAVRSWSVTVDAITAAVISSEALGSINLSQLNAMICFDLNTVARR